MVRLLTTFDDFTIVGQASDGLDALRQVSLCRPDVVFLDVEMPELNGLETARVLTTPQGPMVVFVTAYDRYAVEAFDCAAVDYLVKPVDAQRLGATINRLRSRQATTAPALQALFDRLKPRAPSRLAVRVGGTYAVFQAERVSAALASGDYTTIICDDAEHLADDSLDALMLRLNGADFIRVHRRAVINLAFLKALERLGDRKYQAVLCDHKRTVVPISRDKLATLKQHLGL